MNWDNVHDLHVKKRLIGATLEEVLEEGTVSGPITVAGYYYRINFTVYWDQPNYGDRIITFSIPRWEVHDLPSEMGKGFIIKRKSPNPDNVGHQPLPEVNEYRFILK